MTKVLINQYSLLDKKDITPYEDAFSKNADDPKGAYENFQRGSINFPIQYYLNNTVDPRYDLPIHWHKEFELIHVISGSYNTFIADHEVSLQKDDMCFLPSRILHGDGRIKGQALYESVVFDIDMLRIYGQSSDFFITDIINNSILIDNVIKSEKKELTETAKKFFDCIKSSYSGYELIATGLLLVFMGLLKKEHLYADKNTMPQHNTRHMGQIQEALNLIHKEYAKDLDLEQLASKSGLSTKYFCRVFKESTDRSPIEYLNWFRVNQACTCLRKNTESNLSEIAYSCGFNDLSYFIKIFRRYKGMTPLKYRNMEE